VSTPASHSHGRTDASVFTLSLIAEAGEQDNGEANIRRTLHYFPGSLQFVMESANDLRLTYLVSGSV
jgi:hypothetical protein